MRIGNKLHRGTGAALTGLLTAGLTLGSPAASAAPLTLKGSDTLFGAITDAINTLGLQGDLQYVGGGSGTGEAAILARTQSIAPMSRAFADTALATASQEGISVAQHVVGLDGVSIFVKASEGVAQISIPVLQSIFGGDGGAGTPAACASASRVRDWSQVPGSGKTGPIQALRRNDDSGTTDTFEKLVGVKAFCPDVQIKATTADIAAETSSNPAAIAYAGDSARQAGQNKPLAIGKTEAGPFVAPSTATIRHFTYPLARRLYIVEAQGSVTRTGAEETLLRNLLDRSFFDPILVTNEFVTCDPSGCP